MAVHDIANKQSLTYFIDNLIAFQIKASNHIHQHQKNYYVNLSSHVTYLICAFYFLISEEI